MLIYELSNVVSDILDDSKCEECGATLLFSYVESHGMTWFVYTKCPKGCFDKDEYNLFKIERKNGE